MVGVYAGLEAAANDTIERPKQAAKLACEGPSRMAGSAYAR